MDKVSGIIRQLTEIGLSLLALGIVAGLLAPNVPFVGAVASNITGLIAELGAQGITGLLGLGVILWLVQNK